MMRRMKRSPLKQKNLGLRKVMEKSIRDRSGRKRRAEARELKATVISFIWKRRSSR